ncbi:MAG: hypothetical protein RIG62_14665 [Cyclobacteriaceae bacterium]
MKNKNIILSSLLFVAVTIFSSCEEIIDPPEPPEETASIIIASISPEETYVKAALDLQTNISFDTLSNYSISIGGEPAEVVETNGTTVTVKVPLELSPGEHLVSLSHGGESISSPSQLNVLDHAELTVEGVAMALTENPEYPIVAINEEGEVLMPIFTNPDNESPSGAVYIHNDIRTYMSFDESLLPEIVNTAGYTMLFANYTDVSFDVAVISPDGELSIHRNLEHAELGNSRNARRESAGSLGSLADAASTFSIAGCLFGDPMLAAGVPAAAVNGIAHCRSPLMTTVNGALYSAPISSIENSAPAFGVYSNDFGCDQVMRSPYRESVTDCSEILVTEGIDLDLASRLLRDKHAESLELARQSLQYGGGDVQITLTWDNTSDMDLHVTEPNGERIYYDYPTSSSGGMLDVDDIDGYGPENIFWSQGQSPQGIYQVEVNHYEGESAANFTVLVQSLGETRQYTGNLAPYETISVVTFTLGETLPEGRFEPANLNARVLTSKK